VWPKTLASFREDVIFFAARIIFELVAAGARIGITANSHKVIGKLLDETLEVPEEWGLPLLDPEQGQGRLVCTTKGSEVFDALGASCQAVAGTRGCRSGPKR
jgi:hypothetical protein